MLCFGRMGVTLCHICSLAADQKSLVRCNAVQYTYLDSREVISLGTGEAYLPAPERILHEDPELGINHYYLCKLVFYLHLLLTLTFCNMITCACVCQCHWTVNLFRAKSWFCSSCVHLSRPRAEFCEHWIINVEWMNEPSAQKNWWQHYILSTENLFQFTCV